MNMILSRPLKESYFRCTQPSGEIHYSICYMSRNDFRKVCESRHALGWKIMWVSKETYDLNVK